MAASVAVLTPEELAFYGDNGFVAPGYRLSAAELDSLRDQTNAVIDANPHWRTGRSPIPTAGRSSGTA
jgi:hypothetical protein